MLNRDISKNISIASSQYAREEDYWLKKLSGEYAGRAGFVEIDVDKGGALARKYGIRSIPAAFVFKNGKKLNEIIGAKDAEVYRSALDSALEG